MLRKRTSFKPNLQQIATPSPAAVPPSVVTSTRSSAAAPTTPSASAASARSSQAPDSTPAPTPTAPTSQAGRGSAQTGGTPTPTSDATKSPTKNGIPSNSANVPEERVQEAISHLTSERLEPIKLSLRNSANKNVKIKDLLFFNPPMTKDQKKHKRNVSLAKKRGRDTAASDTPIKTRSASSCSQDDAAVEEPSSTPKVKLGPEGKLILDESSTIINRRNTIKEQEPIIEDNEDVISKTNYDSFRRRPSNSSQTKWSTEDTKKFYHALTVLGTDFSMMESLLFDGCRSRTELHRKFKREERVNKPKVDIALANRISLSSEELDNLKDLFDK